MNAAWDAEIPVASENALPCYDRQGYNKILEHAKPRNDPDGRHLSAFTYLRLNQALLHEPNLKEFQLFVKRMHGTSLFPSLDQLLFGIFITLWILHIQMNKMHQNITEFVSTILYQHKLGKH